MPETTELLYSNLYEVFSERDPERRRAAIGRTYMEDVTFIDPDGEFVGRQALSDRAQELLDGASAGDTLYALLSHLNRTHDSLRLETLVAQPDRPAAPAPPASAAARAQQQASEATEPAHSRLSVEGRCCGALAARITMIG